MKKLFLTCLAAGATVLSLQSSAKATELLCTFANTSSCNGTLGKWTVTNFAVNPSSGSSPLHIIKVKDGGDFLYTNVFFVDPTVQRPQVGGFSYDVAYSGVNDFLHVTAGTTGIPTGTPPGVTIVGTEVGNPGNIILPSTTFTGSTTPDTNFLPGNKAASILYSWNYTSLPAGSSLATLASEIAAVPAPLSILGAGMAFGFSRRMRQRIKASA